MKTETFITCPKCRCVNSNDSLFCKKCGTSLDFANSYTVNKQPDIPVPVSSEEAAPTAEENAAPEE